MKKAIVTGATGFVGSHLVLELAGQGIDVLAIGRQPQLLSTIGSRFDGKVQPCTVDLDNIGQLDEAISNVGWEVGDDTCFFHLAWKGDKGLADGSPECQVQNIIITSECLQTASRLGCKRFINVGTVEELYFDDYIDRNLWLTQDYYSSHGYYAASKSSAHKMNMIVSYLEKIEYIHARFSVAVSRDLKGFQTGYVARTILRLVNGENIDPPASKQLYELVEVSDLARALHTLGIKGRNKVSYYIGHGTPATLGQIFSEIASQRESLASPQQYYESSASFLSFFDAKPFVVDAGYKPTPLTSEDFS